MLTAAQIAIDRNTHGYALRGAVPLSELGFRPQPGKIYPGDFGIVYFDKQAFGQSRARRNAKQ